MVPLPTEFTLYRERPHLSLHAPHPCQDHVSGSTGETAAGRARCHAGKKQGLGPPPDVWSPAAGSWRTGAGRSGEGQRREGVEGHVAAWNARETGVREVEGLDGAGA